MMPDKEIEDNIKALAQRKIDLEMEISSLQKVKEQLMILVEKNDNIIEENLKRIAEIDKMFS